MKAGLEYRMVLRCLLSCLSVLLVLAACDQQSVQRFYTWQGIGPDKWASVWLIHRYIDPEAQIAFVPVNGPADTSDSIAFDIPAARYRRTQAISAIASLMQAYPGADSAGARQVAQVIHDIEVIAWGERAHPRSVIAEGVFRDLQHRYGRDQVPPACYMAFFDNLERALLRDSAQQSVSQFQQALQPDADCASRAVGFALAADDKALVQELPVREILDRLQAGKKVVFVDARESSEYYDFRIPGAVHLPLRAVNARVADQFADADLVVAYCLKDFRGFEVAKALKQRAGIQQAVIMNPYGIRGWQASGLPVTGRRALSQQDAQDQMQACIANPAVCLSAPDGT